MAVSVEFKVPCQGNGYGICLEENRGQRAVTTQVGLIKQVALQALKQFAVSLIFISVSTFFASSISVVLTMTAVAALSALVTAAIEAMLLFKSVPSDSKEAFAGHMGSGLLFSSLVDSCTRDPLVHEYSHLLAVNALFKDARPTITLGFSPRCTFFASARHLTKWGRYLGYNRSLAVISAAGPLGSTLTSCTLIALAHRLPVTSIRLKCHLYAMAIQSVANHVLYALSAFWNVGQLSHDFVAIWFRAGIHPLVSACFLLALPLLVAVVVPQVSPSLISKSVGLIEEAF